MQSKGFLVRWFSGILMIFLSSVFFFVFFAISYPTSGYAADSQKITVSAAISLKNAFDDISKIFESRNPGTKVYFNFGASGNLMMQIEEGAPVDVFASAAEHQMDVLAGKGMIEPGTRKDFAGNTVVLVVLSGSESKSTLIKGFGDLAAPGVKRIAIGDPKTVPAGKYAEEALEHFRLMDAIKGKLIYGQHVRQVLDYVARGEVDAGLVYSTDAMTEAGHVRVAAVVPPGSHKPVVYPIAVIKGSANERLARAFISLVTSPEGKSILRKYGFESK